MIKGFLRLILFNHSADAVQYRNYGLELYPSFLSFVEPGVSH